MRGWTSRRTSAGGTPISGLRRQRQGLVRGLYASWPLFDGLRTRGRVAQARSDQATLRIEEAQLLDGIALQVRDATTLRMRGRSSAIADTVGQAERLLALAEKGYEYV